MKLRLFGRKSWEILPALALWYFAYSVLLVGLFFYAIDAFMLPALEDRGKICSHSWRQEDKNIVRQMKERNYADEDNPVWRSDGFPVSEKCPKSKRILVMGDSFAWGSGYANLNTIWWRQLARELQRRGYNDVEVIAAGLSGAPTRLELRWAKKLVPIYKPDAVIWGYVTNDPEEGSEEWGQGFVKNVIPVDNFPVATKDFICRIFPNLGDELFYVFRRSSLTTKFSGEKNGFDFADWELKILEGENWKAYEKTVAQLGEFVQTLTGPSFAVTLPCAIYSTHNHMDGRNLSAKIHDYYTVRYAPVERLFISNKIKFYNCLDSFLEFARRDPRMDSPDPPLWLGANPANGHPGPMATHAHAVHTADILETYYPGCLGKKSMPIETASVPHINDWVPAAIDLKQDNDHIEFTYPTTDDVMLKMPIRKPFVQLNLETPVHVESINLAGANLDGANVDFSWEDPYRHFDDGSVVQLPSKTGKNLTWELEPSPQTSHINTIRVSAHFNGPDRVLRLKLRTSK